MKTVQIGNGKIAVIQFETLQEIQKLFTEEALVERFNFAYRAEISNLLLSKDVNQTLIEE